jgi:HEAT repeat protein
VRKGAAALLERMGPRARPVTRALVGALKDTAPESCFAAARALGRLEMHLDKALPILVAAVLAQGHDAQPALEVLDGLGPKARPVISLLQAVLADRETGTARAVAAEMLLRFGAPPSGPCAVLVEMLASNDPWQSSAAWHVLRRLKRPPHELADGLRKLLRHKEQSVRVTAAVVLVRLGDDGSGPLSTLRRALTRPSTLPGESSEIIGALGELGPRAAPAIPELQAVAERDPNQYEAFACLGKMGPAGRPALPYLRKLLQQGWPHRIDYAAEALECLGPAGAEALPDLMLMLRSPREEDRIAAARALGAMGRQAKPAVPRLEVLLREGPAVRLFALAALLRITHDRERYFVPLVRMIGRHKPAIAALDYLGPRAIEALPELAAAAQSQDHEINEAAVWLLEKLGPGAGLAMPVLAELLRHSDADTRRRAAVALGKLGPAALPALPRLRALAEDEDEHVAGAAAEAVRALTTGRPHKR